jgi:NADH-quinone oxidoreductase subunit J
MPELTDILFYVLAGLTLTFGLLCVANPVSRNPVTSAMFLVLTLIAMSGLFILLNAFFLAAIQILVYAGAVMVLFLFVIMLLDIQEEERRRMNRVAVFLGSLSVAAIAGLLIHAVAQAKPVVEGGAVVEGTTKVLGRRLFEVHLLPFEVLGLLLLVAMVGVILLSKKEMK